MGAGTFVNVADIPRRDCLEPLESRGANVVACVFASSSEKRVDAKEHHELGI
jgi:hypothetical protein